MGVTPGGVVPTSSGPSGLDLGGRFSNTMNHSGREGGEHVHAYSGWGIGSSSCSSIFTGNRGIGHAPLGWKEHEATDVDSWGHQES